MQQSSKVNLFWANNDLRQSDFYFGTEEVLKLCFQNTVKPVYNDHPKFVAVVDRWSLFRGTLCYKISIWDLKIVAVIGRRSFTQVWLYIHLKFVLFLHFYRWIMGSQSSVLQCSQSFLPFAIITNTHIYFGKGFNLIWLMMLYKISANVYLDVTRCVHIKLSTFLCAVIKFSSLFLELVVITLTS